MNPIIGLRIIIAASMVLSGAGFAAGPEKSETGSFTVAREVARNTSRPMRDIIVEMQGAEPSNPDDYVIPNIFLDLDDLGEDISSNGELSPAQRSFQGNSMPATILEFDGLNRNFGGGGTPPDTTGDAGPDHYFQWVNTSWALFDKTTGALVSGPTAGSSFWDGLGGFCDDLNRGDPLVLWDDQAQRWVVSQFAFTSTGTPPWFQCVAVSTTADPLGSYHQYAFEYSDFGFNDYGKMGVWTTEDGAQNGYLFTQHEFQAGGGFTGSFAVAERDRMLEGLSAQFIRVDGTPSSGALPFHVEGEFPLASGSCPMFVRFSSLVPGYNIWEMCVDWDSGTADFDPEPTFIESDPYVLGLNGIPQMEPGAPALDDFGRNTMYLAVLRSFGPTGPAEAYGVINHAVDVGDDQAGARWIQFGIPMGGTPGLDFDSGFEDFVPAPLSVPQMRIIDQGTYAPDSDSRWMGGINMDKSGNIAYGYNVASINLNPEIRIAGRLRTDPPGILRDEAQCSPTNTGAQTGLFGGRARWGDYATMGVDPDDQCTFWFTNEYYPVTSFGTWDTRVCSIKFDSCGDPDYVLETNPNTRISVCSNDGTAEIRVAEFGTLGENVVLSQGSVPAGTSLDFGSNSVAAGDSTTVTVTGSGALVDGLYSATVSGLGAGLNRATDILLGVSTTTPGVPTLFSPFDGQTGSAPRPSFEWSSAAGGVEYKIEIASDDAFTQIIEMAVVEGESYTSGLLLDEETTYYWRVTALNFCGSGTTSAEFSFTTGVAGECPAGTTPNVVFADDVSDDSVPWVLDNAQGGADTLWNKEIPPAGTGLTTRAWWAENASANADQRLVSPTVLLPPGQRPVTIAWDTYHQFEEAGGGGCWDGGFIEINVDGNGWEPLGNDRNLADPYLGQLQGNGPGGIAHAWCIQPAGGSSVRSVFLLDDFIGENVQVRFRTSADGNTVGAAPAGWGVDNIEIQSCDD